MSRATRRVVVSMSLSIDGFMATPDGGLDWQTVDEELHQHFNDELRGMGAFVSGRVTWQLMAGYWPTADEDPDASAPEREFAGIWRETPKIVYSRTLQDAGWGTTIVREIVADEVRALLAEPGGDLALGGAQVCGEFIRLGLVDAYRLYVHPVAIGSGLRLFPAGTRVDARLVGTRTFGSGVVLLDYERA
jgi:dihydrofolate reductase